VRRRLPSRRVRLDPLDPKTSRHAGECEFTSETDPAVLRILLKVQDGRTGWGLRDDLRRSLERIALFDHRWFHSGHLDCGSEARDPLGLIRPHARLQPTDSIVVGDVDRSHIDPPTPRNVGDVLRRGYRADRFALE
jgi:hypothetical protein